MMSATVTDLTEDAGRWQGVKFATQDGPLEVSRHWSSGCDGRASTVRAASGLAGSGLGLAHRRALVPFSKKSGRSAQGPGTPPDQHDDRASIENDYWQWCVVIGKGGIGRIHADGSRHSRRCRGGARLSGGPSRRIAILDDISC